MVLKKILLTLLICHTVYSQNEHINLSKWNYETEKWFNKEVLDTLGIDAVTFPIPVVYKDSIVVNNVSEEFKQFLFNRNHYIGYINSMLNTNFKKIYIVERFYYNSPIEITVFIDLDKYIDFNLNNKNEVSQIIIEKEQEKIIDEYEYWSKSQYYGFDTWRCKQPISNLIIATEIIVDKNKYKIQYVRF